MNVEPLRVLIVDDSRIFRSVLEEALSGRDDVNVVGSVWSGEKAIEFARTSLPDVVTLDIEMPGLGGMETLKALRVMGATHQRAMGVLLVSSHTKRGATVTVEGLQEGAFDFVTKPDSADFQENVLLLRRQLIEKIDAYRSRRPFQFPGQASGTRILSRHRRSTRFRAVVIGASTGGPQALARLLPVLTPVCPVPMFLVQHLPPDFMSYFAASLSRRCGVRIVEARDGASVEPGVLYLAPGDRHLVINKRDGKIVTGLSDSPPENGCRPAVDVLFRSASAAYGGQVLAVVLSGMGCDGAKGSSVLKRAGAHVIVQDEPSSVVWGMPSSVVAAGAADEIQPIDEIASTLLSHLGIGG
jgi:two-component system chemotaxis response regulator CheB